MTFRLESRWSESCYHQSTSHFGSPLLASDPLWKMICIFILSIKESKDRRKSNSTCLNRAYLAVSSCHWHLGTARGGESKAIRTVPVITELPLYKYFPVVSLHTSGNSFTRRIRWCNSVHNASLLKTSNMLSHNKTSISSNSSFLFRRVNSGSGEISCPEWLQKS